MKRLLWLARRYATRWTLALGLLGVVAALALQWTTIEPLESRVEVLAAAHKDSRAGRLADAEQVLVQGGGPRMQLNAFYGHFDRGDKLTDLLVKLHVVGRGVGIDLKRGEYRLSSTPERRLDRYQVVLPVRGHYQAIRAFIATALHELPTMSLDQVQFQRREVGDPLVDAQVSFSFHLVR